MLVVFYLGWLALSYISPVCLNHQLGGDPLLFLDTRTCQYYSFASNKEGFCHADPLGFMLGSYTEENQFKNMVLLLDKVKMSYALPFLAILAKDK